MAAATRSSSKAPRTMRADAQRNREAILAAAREIFERDGVLASLDGIAVRAGVGNATLYRNFATRDDLLAAVMVANVEAALAEAEVLLATSPPREALAEWLFRLTWQLRIWHDLPYCIASARCDPKSPVKSANAQLIEKTRGMLDAAKTVGAALPAVTAEDLFELAVTLSWGVDRFGDDEATARRRVAMATAGAFTAASGPRIAGQGGRGGSRRGAGPMRSGRPGSAA